MRYAVAALMALASAPAAAQPSQCFASTEDPAWTIAVNEPQWVWRQGDKTVELITGSVGTGIPRRTAVGPDGQIHVYMYHDDDLIVDMQVYQTVPCVAPASKIWVGKECSSVLIAIESDHRYFFQEAGNPVLSCLVKSQHYAVATIFLTCDSGAEARLFPEDDGTIRWNETIMSAYDGPLPCTADDAAK